MQMYTKMNMYNIYIYICIYMIEVFQYMKNKYKIRAWYTKALLSRHVVDMDVFSKRKTFNNKHNK